MISPYTELLMGLRCAVKLHERSLDAIRRQYGLTRMETDILAFLVNNPGKDTAADMVALRGFKRGNVSQGVEALIQSLSVQERETYIRLTGQILKNAKQGLEEENESWNKTKIS